MSGSHENEVWVDDYVTSTGTHVTGHWRKRNPRGGGGGEPEPVSIGGGSGSATALATQPAATSTPTVVRPAGPDRQTRVNAGLQALRQRRTTTPSAAPAEAHPPQLTEAAQRGNDFNANNLRDVDAAAGQRYVPGMVLQAKSGATYTATHISPEGLVTMSSGHQFRAADLTSTIQPDSESSQCPSCGQFQGPGHTCPEARFSEDDVVQIGDGTTRWQVAGVGPGGRLILAHPETGRRRFLSPQDPEYDSLTRLDQSPAVAEVSTGLEALRRRRQALEQARGGRAAAVDTTEPATAVEEVDGADRCPSCGQFQGPGHTCPMPEGLPGGNYAELKGEERTKQMLADLQDSVTAIVQSGQLGRWLDAMASNGLNRWSFNNRLLSVLQVLQRNPNAELHLMGFRQWEKYNRSVTKGEKAVWILAPMTRKIREEDDNGKTRERTIVTGFKSVPVFNIDQTHGDPMPSSIVNHAGGEATPGTLDGLRERVGQAGYAYEETEIPDYRDGNGTLGYTDPKSKKIVVDPRLSDAQKASTIAHELGHVHCGHVDGDYSEYVQHRGRMETEAEMTAYMVNRARGMSRSQADSFSPGYIAGWSRGKPEVITGAMERATKAFNKIMDGPWSSNSTKE